MITMNGPTALMASVKDLGENISVSTLHSTAYRDTLYEQLFGILKTNPKRDSEDLRLLTFQTDVNAGYKVLLALDRALNPPPANRIISRRILNEKMDAVATNAFASVYKDLHNDHRVGPEEVACGVQIILGITNVLVLKKYMSAYHNEYRYEGDYCAYQRKCTRWLVLVQSTKPRTECGYEYSILAKVCGKSGRELRYNLLWQPDDQPLQNIISECVDDFPSGSIDPFGMTKMVGTTTRARELLAWWM
ncbi:hypothetical protein JKP88DRAFT_248440 [Tribonema minus]|uniref:Uncharacterized protein n=1 Tax=Tribonema minus TaxID=303371 RepID=A0A835YWM8_9STRA|nr:hypothetical protein JKP88DRAFT_248440 [Tribonema minus]